MDYAKSKGIVCTNSPGKNAEAVAEYTVGLALAHIRHIPEGNVGFNNAEYIQRYGNYDLLGYELEQKKVGLVGFGQIARRVCRILKGFECEILVYDPFVDADAVEKLGAVPCGLDMLLQQSDVVSLH
ncbi:MAG: hypothetical protein LUE92_04170, partial [Clostridiales bacterium]|nr:hypothetical protein [Clostridiales bacterium]